MYKNNPDRSSYTKQLLPEYFLDGERNAMVVLKYFFFFLMQEHVLNMLRTNCYC